MENYRDNPFALTGKKILISGASSGIGRQCAIHCSYSGADVIIAGRDKDRLQETYDSLNPGGHSQFIGDLCDFEALEAFISDIKKQHGKIDGFISSAGFELTLPLQFTKPKDYQLLFNTNIISGFEITRLLLKKNILNSKSSLVFISSVMGIVGQAGIVGYSSSKGALISGVKSLALELVSYGIRANCILPAVCKTPLTDKFFSKLSEEKRQDIIKSHPMGLGEPDDVALAAIYLLSGASKWVTGSSLVIDGGYSIQ
jgi:NAD(P)-dependent dehydrogenase (short-subunit alcohol dehydrogenase family)